MHLIKLHTIRLILLFIALSFHYPVLSERAQFENSRWHECDFGSLILGKYCTFVCGILFRGIKRTCLNRELTITCSEVGPAILPSAGKCYGLIILRMRILEKFPRENYTTIQYMYIAVVLNLIVKSFIGRAYVREASAVRS